jgi:DNA-binding IclR family transcriptional regulator
LPWSADTLSSRKSPDDASGPLERYIRIFEVLAAFPDGLSAIELETALNLPRTTVNRLLRTLLSVGAVEVLGRRGGRYFLGRRMSRILQSDGGWVQATSERALAGLARASGQTAFIARRAGTAIRSVAMQSGDSSVGIYVEPGHDLPRHASASGKVLTAFEGEEGLSRLPGTLEAFTERTLVEREALRAEYAAIRRDGYALDRSEHVEGIASIACPVFAREGELPPYAVGLTGPAERVLSLAERDLLPLLKRTASELRAAFWPKG